VPGRGGIASALTHRVYTGAIRFRITLRIITSRSRLWSFSVGPAHVCGNSGVERIASGCLARHLGPGPRM
jgi:hypothetical protein